MAFIRSEYPETIPTHARGALEPGGPPVRFDTVVMGRGTYEPASREGITSPYAHLKQYVFSRSLPVSPDPAVEIVAGDPVAFVRRLKVDDGREAQHPRQHVGVVAVERRQEHVDDRRLDGVYRVGATEHPLPVVVDGHS